MANWIGILCIICRMILHHNFVIYAILYISISWDARKIRIKIEHFVIKLDFFELCNEDTRIEDYVFDMLLIDNR